MHERFYINLSEDFPLILGQRGFLLPRLPPKDDVLDAFQEADNKIEHILHNSNGYFLEKTEEITTTYLNEFLVSLFEVHNRRYYRIQKTRILNFFLQNSEEETYIHVGETYQAFESKLYYPCLCSSMTFVEKLLADSNNPKNTNYKKLLQKKLSILDKIYDDNDTVIHKSNLKGFLDFLSESIDFSEDEPFNVNRHWLLHGRVNRKIGGIDCLKIFLVIDSLIELNEKLR